MTARPLPASSPPKLSDSPFFIIGCVRSGTTMLRDVLRRHPNLACPEETHFFRWAEPFGTDGLNRVLSENAVLKRHREIDGITQDEFIELLRGSHSRAHLYNRYMALYVQRNKPQATRWFDKTPQNVYGAMLAASAMPKARFVHIVRNPYNVAASLRIGRIVKVNDVIGAANYWNESVHIIRGLRRAYPRRVHELRYEDFMRNAPDETRKLLDFVEEPYDPAWFDDFKPRASDHSSSGVLNAEDHERVQMVCRFNMQHYGYLKEVADAAP